MSSDRIKRVVTTAWRDHLFRLGGRVETALIEAETDKFCLLVICRQLPAERSLGGKHSIRECDMADATRL